MSESIDYKHINCHLLLSCADALHPDQLQRMRDKENAITPLNDEAIERILATWRIKLKRESLKLDGYLVLGYDA